MRELRAGSARGQRASRDSMRDSIFDFWEGVVERPLLVDWISFCISFLILSLVVVELLLVVVVAAAAAAAADKTIVPVDLW